MPAILDDSIIPPRPKQVMDITTFLQGMDKLPAVLAKMGFTSMRPGQDRVVINVMSRKDTYAVLPTGLGKSSCFIIPTLCNNWGTIVFSPLVSLMQDQVNKLLNWGIAAGQVTGLQSPSENQYIMDKWAMGELQFLYVAPERQDDPKFRSVVANRDPDLIVLDECFPGEFFVSTEFGPRTFSDLHQSRLAGQAMPLVHSYHPERGVELRPILNTWNKGVRKVIRVTLYHGGCVECTPEHKWFYEHGEIEAKNLKHGDRVFRLYRGNGVQLTRGLNSDQKQLVIGSYLGDGGVQKTGSVAGVTTARIQWTHGIKQKKYAIWKASLLGGDGFTLIDKNGYSQKNAVAVRSKVFQLPDVIPIQGGRWEKKGNVPSWMLDAMDERALAIWVMDDGFLISKGSGSVDGFLIHTNAFTEEVVYKLSSFLKSRFGLTSSVLQSKGFWYLSMTKESAKSLIRMVSPFIVPELYYKFPGSESCSNTYIWDSVFAPAFAMVKSVDEIDRECEVFDIEVEKNHNFFVHSKNSGKNQHVMSITDCAYLVHNCHTLSAWCHTFRPAYVKIKDFIRDTNPHTVLCLTATSTEEIEEDVRNVMGLQEAEKIFFYPERSNLKLSSRNYTGPGCIRDAVAAINGPCVVYCCTQNKVEETADFLQRSLHGKKKVLFFHGDISPSDKQINMSQFMDGVVDVMVATNAFGLGVDKSDVRGVIHRDVPGSIEQLAQEVGRAGRDGADSQCITFLDPDSFNTQNFFIDSAYPSKDKIRQVYDYLVNASDATNTCWVTGKELAYNIRTNVKIMDSIFNTMMAYKVVERFYDKQKIFKIKFIAMAETPRLQDYCSAIESIGCNMNDGSITFDLGVLGTYMSVTEAAARNNVKALEKGGSIVIVKRPFQGKATRVIGDLNLIDFEFMEEKAKYARKKLQAVRDYFNVPDEDKHKFLTKYFQDVNAKKE